MAELLDELIPASSCRVGRAARMLAAMFVAHLRATACNPDGNIQRRLVPEVAP